MKQSLPQYLRSASYREAVSELRAAGVRAFVDGLSYAAPGDGMVSAGEAVGAGAVVVAGSHDPRARAVSVIDVEAARAGARALAKAVTAMNR